MAMAETLPSPATSFLFWRLLPGGDQQNCFTIILLSGTNLSVDAEGGLRFDLFDTISGQRGGPLRLDIFTRPDDTRNLGFESPV